MKMNDEKQKLVKSLLRQFENISQGLGFHLEDLHNNKNQELTNEVTIQHILDAHQEVRILRELIVTLFDLKDIDPRKKNYLDNWFKI